ncbi:hypothetical protein [Paraclostridium bifermentans]|uniref:hypothetical protein n=1 Tax=Paraclostridium bifermentans TaxID=1490 RepID=UPI0022DE9B07|nr:hypothetical protein [Paraclostridium bifermentans]
MRENLKGFINLIVLIMSCCACIALPLEITHQLVLENYLLSANLLLLLIWVVSFGADAYGVILKQIKKHN